MLGKTALSSSGITGTRKKEATQCQISTSFMKSKNDKKRKREIIEKFELTHQKIHQKLDNPFKVNILLLTNNRQQEVFITSRRLGIVLVHLARVVT